jgi:hypothetical protein
MKHPSRSDFDAAVNGADVTVTFKPTNSVFSFIRLDHSDDVAQVGRASQDTRDYAAHEVQALAARIASEVGTAIWRVGDEQAADRLTTVRPPPVLGDEGD